MRAPVLPISLALAVPLLVAACQKDPPPEKKSAPAAIPVDAFALVSLPDGTKLSELGTMFKSLDAQAGMMAGMMSAQATSALSSLLGGVVIEADAPAHLVVLDPTKYPLPVVYVGKASGKGEGVELRPFGERTAVGAPKALDAVAPLIPSLAAPEKLRAAVFPKRIIRTYRAEIEAFPANMAASMGPEGASMKPLMQLYASFAIALEDNVEMVELSIENADGRGTFRTYVKAKKGSVFEKFCAAQKSHDFSLLARLPDANPIIFDSNIVAGGAKQALIDATGNMIDMFTGIDSARKKDYQTAVSSMAAILDGRFAASMGMSGLGEMTPKMNGVWLAGTTEDGAKNLIDALFSSWASGERIELAGTAQTMVYTADAGEHAGVAYGKQVQTVEFTATELDAYQTESYVGVVERDVVMVLAAEEAMKRTIDRLKARNRRELSPFEKRAVAAAVERKASAVMAMDMADFIPGAPSTIPAFAFTVAFSPDSMTLDSDLFKFEAR